jgi:hypothetical protein
VIVTEEPVAKELPSVALDADPRSVALGAAASKPINSVAVVVAAASSSVAAVTLRELRKGIIKIKI